MISIPDKNARIQQDTKQLLTTGDNGKKAQHEHSVRCTNKLLPSNCGNHSKTEQNLIIDGTRKQVPTTVREIIHNSSQDNGVSNESSEMENPFENTSKHKNVRIHKFAVQNKGYMLYIFSFDVVLTNS